MTTDKAEIGKYYIVTNDEMLELKGRVVKITKVLRKDEVISIDLNGNGESFSTKDYKSKLSPITPALMVLHGIKEEDLK